MRDNNLKRINISVISVAVCLIIAGVVCFYLLPGERSSAVILGELTAFLSFIASVYYYNFLRQSASRKKARSSVYFYIAKLAVIAVVFYFIVKSEYLDFLSFAITFLVLFTILFNLEIILVYRDVVFKREKKD